MRFIRFPGFPALLPFLVLAFISSAARAEISPEECGVILSPRQMRAAALQASQRFGNDPVLFSADRVTHFVHNASLSKLNISAGKANAYVDLEEDGSLEPIPTDLKGSVPLSAFSPDGDAVAVAATRLYITVTRPETRTIQFNFSENESAQVIEVDTQAGYAAVSTSTNRLHLIDLTFGLNRVTWAFDDLAPMPLGFYPKGRLLMKVDELLLIGDLNNQVQMIQGLAEGKIVSVSKDLRRVVVQEAEGYSVFELDPDSSSARLLKRVKVRRPTRQLKAEFSADGRRLAVHQLGDRNVAILDLENLNAPADQLPAGRGLTALALTPGGDFLIAGYRDDSLMVWERRTGTARFHSLAPARASSIKQIKVSSDCLKIATHSSDGLLRVWNLAEILTSHVAGPEREGLLYSSYSEYLEFLGEPDDLDPGEFSYGELISN
jgi:WD40 repeat protein